MIPGSVIAFVLSATSGDLPAATASAPSIERLNDLRTTIALKRKRRRRRPAQAAIDDLISAVVLQAASAGTTPSYCPDCGGFSSAPPGGQSTPAATISLPSRGRTITFGVQSC